MKSRHFSFLLQWGIILATLIFVSRAFYENWQEVTSLQISGQAWLYLIAALAISLLSHGWSGILWDEILRNLRYPVSGQWAAIVFLATEIAKYLPGDVWQVYGRLQAARKMGVPISIGIVSIILQSVYLAAAGLGFGLLTAFRPLFKELCVLGLIVILVGVHPTVFARVASWIERLPTTSIVEKLFSRLTKTPWNRPRIQYYPHRVILGQFLALGLRSISFLLVVLVFTSISNEAIAPLIGGFGFAWALGVVSPISGGVGVFEATAIGLLDGVTASSVILGSVILYRLIAIMTEAIGSGVGFLLSRTHNTYS
jgi:glycosyltransferase 2 family protein